jgi:Tol biopolymer transport system component
MTVHHRPSGYDDVTFDVSPNGRTLVFTGAGQGERDLYLFDLESKRVTPLTSSRDYEVCPVFSPDGERLAFTRGTPGVRADQLCVMDLSTREVVQVTDADENVSSPVFLPDGKRVLCTVETEYRWGGLAPSWNEGGELRIIDLQTGKQTPVQTPAAPVFRPRVTRDGKWIGWIDKGAHIAPMSAPTEAEVLQGATALALGADGTNIAFSEGGGGSNYTISIDDKAGNTRQRIYSSRSPIFHTVFSPDGKHLYFVAERWRKDRMDDPAKRVMRTTIANGQVEEIIPSTRLENPLGR